MAEGQDANNASEPSMEEILASIRKIIADEDAPKDPDAATDDVAPAAGDDVLELTQLVEDDGSVVDLKPQEEMAPEPVVVEEPAFEPVPSPVPEEPAMPDMPMEPVSAPAPETPLVSERAGSAAGSSLSSLVNMVQMERLASGSTAPGTPVGNGARTLEQMVIELMRPMLKEWLDQNLPAVVDRLVQKEIERIVRNGGN